MKKLTSIFVLMCLMGQWMLYANGIGIIDGAGVYMTIQESEIHVEVNNQIATITATQVLRNDTDTPTTFKYGFPLNENANPIGLRWFVEGQWQDADVSANTQNTDIPGTGGGTGNSVNSDLQNYLGAHPLFFTPQDMIAVDSVIIMEIKYVELLPYFLGKVSFSFKNDLSKLQDAIVEKQLFEFMLNSERTITDIDLLGIETTDSLTANTAVLTYESYETYADFDYLIEYELSSEELGIAALSTYLPDSLFNCDEYGNGYVSLIIEPESNVDTEIIEKNFSLIIDRSGSMSGNKIQQARDAASFIINNLNFGDFFNIIDFSSSINSLFEQQVPYTLENRATALAYIDAISSGGGTNISNALSTAISEFNVVDPDKANIILFFTDGQATSGITDTPGILNQVNSAVQNAETNVFLFTFGIGDNVDEGLLTLLAQQNNGLVQFVKNEDLESEITSFFLTINNPVLLNTEITFTPDVIDEIYPFPFPNLYKGQQLILSGRYEESISVTMHLEGQAFNVPVAYDFEFELTESNEPTASILPKLWAKQKIDAMTLDYYLAETTEEETFLLNEIDSVSICYGVISVDFTSFEDNSTVEVDDLELIDSKFKVLAYPTIFTDLIQIEIKTDEASFDEISIELVDMQGRSLLKKIDYLQGLNSTIVIDELKGLAKGIYCCKIRIGTEFINIKIVKG